MTQNHLIIFDFDGVIVDSYQKIFATLSRQAELFRIPPIKTHEDFSFYFNGNFFEKLVSNGATEESIARAVAFFNDNQSNLVEETKIFDGIEFALKKLSKKNSLAIVSSNQTPIIAKFCDKNDILPYFKEILGADIETSKTKKIKNLILRHEVGIENAFYVCDTVGDIQEAKAVNVRSIAVTWGYQTKEELSKASPDFFCERPKKLIEMFSDG